MDTFRRAILSALVIVVLLAALVFRLSSCSPDTKTTPSADTSESPPADMSQTAAPSGGGSVKASPKPPYSGAEIKAIYESLELSVAEIRDAGDVTMVHYYKPTGVAGEIISRFDWFDRSTGARELVYGWAYTDSFDIKPDKSFAVLTTGLSHIDGMQSFPCVYRARCESIDGAVRSTGAAEKYYAPLGNSYTIGPDRHASVTDINVTPGFVSFGFGPEPGFESEFYAAYATIPKMDFKHEDGVMTVTLYKTTLSKGAGIPAVKENAYCRIVSSEFDGTNTIFTLQLSDSVSRYHVSTEYSPQSGLPYAVIELANLNYDYPAGW